MSLLGFVATVAVDARAQKLVVHALGLLHIGLGAAVGLHRKGRRLELTPGPVVKPQGVGSKTVEPGVVCGAEADPRRAAADVTDGDLLGQTRTSGHTRRVDGG